MEQTTKEATQPVGIGLTEEERTPIRNSMLLLAQACHRGARALSPEKKEIDVRSVYADISTNETKVEAQIRRHLSERARPILEAPQE